MEKTRRDNLTSGGGRRTTTDTRRKKSYVGQSSRRPLFVWNIHQHAAIKEKEKTLGKTIFLRNFSSFYCRGFWAISRHSENKGVRCDLYPQFYNRACRKRVCNKRSRPILSYVLPCPVGRRSTRRPTTTLWTIFRPTDTRKLWRKKRKNRLFESKPSNLWTISLLFAVSNVAVFSSDPAKRHLLFNPRRNFHAQ